MNREEREALLKAAAKDGMLQLAELKKCRQDVVYWLNTYCWTFDPRQPESDLPFELYPFQAWFAREVYRAICEQVDLGVEKSRDMGVSWIIILVFQYCWLFHPGWNFHLGSRKASEVDRGYTDPAETLLGKFRYNLEKLPPWMQPEKWEKHSRKMVLENPENGNFISGEAATPTFGRGTRKRAIGFDEFAFWDAAEAAYASASQSTGCRIIWSTPYGETNKFAQVMNRKNNEFLSFQ